MESTAGGNIITDVKLLGLSEMVTFWGTCDPCAMNESHTIFVCLLVCLARPLVIIECP